MGWQSNLFNNLLVLSILTSLGLIIYCKIKGTNITEIVKDINESTKE